MMPKSTLSHEDPLTEVEEELGDELDEDELEGRELEDEALALITGTTGWDSPT